MTGKPDALAKYLNYFAAFGVVGTIIMVGWVLSMNHSGPAQQNALQWWQTESITFSSDQRCYVFPGQKLVIFIGDENDAIFDYIANRGGGGLDISGSFGGSFGDGYAQCTVHIHSGDVTMDFDNGKFVMVVTKHGTQLTLADGRGFCLDGQTPLRLRCRPDGTIVVLDELPPGFVEFFENPPPHSAAMVSEWMALCSEAFRKE